MNSPRSRRRKDDTVPGALILTALVCGLPGLALAEAYAPTIPDTPAGHALAAWLDAFNSGDRGKFEAFETAHAPWLTTDREMELRARTGGYDLLSIDKGGRLWIAFRAKERASPAQVSGSLVVRSNDLDHISLLGLAPAGAAAEEIVLDEAERGRVIEGAAKLLEEFYVFPDAAKDTATRLSALQKHGEYRGITDGEVFATRLTDDLRALSHDKHFAVDYFSKAMPDEPPPRPHPDPRQLAANNCGFAKAEHLSPNVGYLKLQMFAEPEHCTTTAIAAMNFLADSDALIIDLRDTQGGAPRMTAIISSYLFNEPTHLDDIYDRQANATEQLWTFPYLPGKKLTGKPVFLLTSRRTFSAGEEFVYDLKTLRRATVIGEATGGGAHPLAPHRIDDHFFVRVPFGRFNNPISKADWEGVGVEPDVKVPAPQALGEALKRARSGS